MKIVSKKEWKIFKLRKACCISVCRICKKPINYGEMFRSGNGHQKRAHETCVNLLNKDDIK